MNPIFEPSAREEFAEAALWYAVKASPLYATEFKNEVHRTLALLCDHLAPMRRSPLRTRGTPAVAVVLNAFRHL